MSLDAAFARMNDPRARDRAQQSIDDAAARVYSTRDGLAQSIRIRTEAVNARREVLTARRAASADRLAQLEEQVTNARRWDAESAQTLIEFEQTEAPYGVFPDDTAVHAHTLAREALIALDPAHPALQEPQ